MYSTLQSCTPDPGPPLAPWPGGNDQEAAAGQVCPEEEEQRQDQEDGGAQGADRDAGCL